MDPSADEAQRIVTIGDAAEWAGLSDQAPGDESGASSSPLGGLLAMLGYLSTAPIRQIAIYSQDDWSRLLQNWTVNGAPPTPAQLAQAGLLGRACRICTGAELRMEEVRANAAAALTAAASQGASQPAAPQGTVAFKLSATIDQHADGEAPKLSAEEISIAFQRYADKLGGAPSADHEPTVEQLSALHFVVHKAQSPPYVDFAVFGPHAIRMVRKLKMSGLILNPSGELFRTELSGPMDYEQWEACYMVFRCALVMLGITSPSAADTYRDHVRQYAMRYTSVCWPLIYQADTRARRELLVRLQRRLAAERARSPEPSAHPYDPQMPWDHVLRSVGDEFAFWKKELEDPAMMILMRAKSSSEEVSGEAPVARTAADHISTPQSSASAPHVAGPPTAKKRRRPSPGQFNQSERVYNRGPDGNWTTNRRGAPLCSKFQLGECTVLPCPVNARNAHQCARCLGSHPAKDCQASTSSKGTKGQNKKGGGGKGKPRRNQW